MFADRDVETFVDSINAMIRDVTKQVRTEMSHEGRSFMGVKDVLRTDPFDAPTTRRVKGTRKPCFAAADPKVLAECLTLLRNFRQRYREAFKLFCDGARDTLFPAGTYLMRVRFKVVCDALHPPWCFTAS
jgi:hypothetical protein